MIQEIKKHIAEVENFSSTNQDEIEKFRIKYLGSKGLLKDYFAAFKEVPNEQKKEFGQVLNTFKDTTQNRYL